MSTEMALNDRIDVFVESLQMDKKYGVVRIDWVLNNDIKGLEGGGDSWSNEKNWEIHSYTESGIVMETLKVFIEKKSSPISFLAEHCKENKLDDEFFFFSDPENSTQSTSKPSLFVDPDSFQLMPLVPKEKDTATTKIEYAKKKIDEEWEKIEWDEEKELTEFQKFQIYETAYVKILVRASQKLNGLIPAAINSVILTPIITRSISNSSTEILGAYMIITSTLCSEDLKNSEDFIRDMRSLKYVCKSHVDEKISQRFFEKLRIESIKSAKAAIMSRNLSHNLGSHVMSYLKQSLKSVTDMEKSGALVEFSPKGAELRMPSKEGEQGALKPELPFLVGTGRFISYLQERQDYIATVSTDYIPYPSTVNFKDDIYDELNPDYRFMRHTEWKGHKPANILLENIARSEGLSRQSKADGKSNEANADVNCNNIIIKYRNFDGLNKQIKDDYSSLRLWNLSLPGGVMGRQAVFSIVENVIRNAAKHGKRNGNEDLVVTFDIVDPLSTIEIPFLKKIDGASHRYTKKSIDIDDLYIVSLTTNTKVEDALEKIKKAIHEPLVKEVGAFNDSNKGIKEMLISAAWLRSIRIEELTEEDRKKITPILRAYSDDQGYLQYVFCLPKVKDVALIVTDDWREKNNIDSNLWKTNGWYSFTWDEYLHERNKNFNFVVLSKDLKRKMVKFGNQEEYIEDLARKMSSNRYFVESDYTDLQLQEICFNVDDCKNCLTKEAFNEATIKLYEQLADEEESFMIAVSDDGNELNIKDSYHIIDIQKLRAKEGDLDQYCYVYRKHNDTKKEFTDFIKSYSAGGDLKKLEFVEGITGGNSTDRLIRHEVLDLRWAYKHLHAMKTKVAIFDERLFANVTHLELKDLQSVVMDWKSALEGITDEEARNYVKDYDNVRDARIASDKGFRAQFKSFTKNQVLEFVEEYYYNFVTFPIEEITPEVYHKKKVDLFTMTKTDNGVIIWGIRFNDCIEEGFCSTCEPIGRIEFICTLDGKVQPKVKRYKGSDMLYDYITLHQGLLDKVYETIPKEFGEDLDIPKIKIAVTKALYNAFVNPKNVDDDYLHGMIVHSGRSKPNFDDMPQHQPFLQYSAVEHALFDCKYSLVEVLDFACFDN